MQIQCVELYFYLPLDIAENISWYNKYNFYSVNRVIFTKIFLNFQAIL